MYWSSCNGLTLEFYSDSLLVASRVTKQHISAPPFDGLNSGYRLSGIGYAPVV